MLAVIFSFLKPLLVSAMILLFIFWARFQWKNRDLLRTASKIPSLYFPLPFFGHALYTLLGPTLLTYWVLRMSKRAVVEGFNAICFWCGPVPVVLVHDQDDIQKILISSSTAEKSIEYEFMRCSVGEGLLTAPWRVWKVTRRHINPLFHPRNLAQLTSMFNDNCRQLVADLSRHVGEGPVDVLHNTTDLALKSVCQTIFGENMEFDTKTEEFKGLKGVVERIPEIAIERFILVWLRVEAIFQFLYKKELNDLNYLWNKFTEEPLKKAKYEISQKSTSDENLNLRDTRDGSSSSGGSVNLLDVYSVLQKKYPTFTDEELKAEMITLYATLWESKLLSSSKNPTLAPQLGYSLMYIQDLQKAMGTDSISVATASCMLLLAYHQDVQAILYEEISEAVGAESDVSMEDLTRMPYLDQVYKETLRWASIIPFIARRTSKEVALKSYNVPAGCTVVLSLFGLNNNPKTFPKPEEFDPERFSCINAGVRDKSAFIPYSGGPRNCIGQRYAELTMKLCIIHVLRRYMLTTVTDIYKLKRKLMLVLVSAEGYQVALHDRT